MLEVLEGTISWIKIQKIPGHFMEKGSVVAALPFAGAVVVPVATRS